MKTKSLLTGLLVCLLAGMAVRAAPAPTPVRFVDYAAQFDRFEARTHDLPMDQRVAAFHAEFDRTVPGLYADRDTARLDRRIAKALADFPSIRPAYRDVERKFPAALTVAVRHFRAIFPDFTPPLPIYLAHELGMRDGGSDYVAGRKVMLFGADAIAVIHHDDSLQPFLDHELFHLEHGRHFADCDQFWCPLWQEGLATFAASTMTPGADDHQLLLDQPAPIRAPTDAQWQRALCIVAKSFDATDGDTIAAAFTGGHHPPDLPARFGYYVGLRVAREAARVQSLSTLTRLNDQDARQVVAAALTRLIDAAGAPCPPPARQGQITSLAPRPA